MRKKVTIYLANLANTKFGCSPATVPLEIGYIKSYALSQLPGEIDIQLYRTFESLYKAIQTKEPDIIGCAWYAWNQSLTTNALTYIKSKFPNIITVVGGANVPDEKERCLKDFREYPCIDIMIPNEGEIPFVSLLKVFIQGGREVVFKTAIDGVFYLSDSQEQVVTGKSVPLTEDINIFPSPYLNGCLDGFLESGRLPIIQTSRGCPYRCTYCVSGKDSLNRVRCFNVERVKAEINYIETNSKSRMLRFTDENLGFVPRDLEIIRFIADKRVKTGYPAALSMYTDKHVNDRIKEIVRLLRDLIPMNVSIQSLTPSVLKNINRKNISIDRIREVVNWAHAHGINATTEIIFGLPGETYESFMEVINKLVELRLDSVAFGTLLMLKETEINTPKSINEYGYKSLYVVAERGYTKIDQFENIEIESWAVENNFFSFEEFVKINLFNMIYSLFMLFGYFKEVVFIWENRGLKVTDVISEVIDNPANYPFFSQHIEKLRKCIVDNLFKTKAEVRENFIKQFSENKQYISLMNQYILSFILVGEMIHPSNQEKMINEVVRASIVEFDKCGKGSKTEFLEEMQFARVLVQNIIIPFWETPQDIITLSSPYDLIAWQNKNYLGKLHEFILSNPIEYQFKIHSLSPYRRFVLENLEEPFSIQSERFFREFRSSNIRRFIVSNEK